MPRTAEEASGHPSLTYREGYEYYMTPRGHHPNANAMYVLTSLRQQMAFYPFEQVQTISPRPILMIAGERADTRYFSETVYKKAREPKELVIVPGASHIDLYDKPQYVEPDVKKLSEFFNKNLK